MPVLAPQGPQQPIWLLSCLYMGVVVVLLQLPTMLIKTALLQAESELAERKRAEQLLEENQKLRGDGQHVMYLDDEDALASAVRRVLELLGYRRTAYINAEKAVEAFRNNPGGFDAVISDMTMPLCPASMSRKRCAPFEPTFRSR